MQNFNFVPCLIWVWNLTAYTGGRTWAKGVQEYGAEECIQAYDGEGDGTIA